MSHISSLRSQPREELTEEKGKEVKTVPRDAKLLLTRIKYVHESAREGLQRA